VVVDVEPVPGEGLEPQKALGDAVRNVEKGAIADDEPEGDAVRGELEPAGAGQGGVQLLPRIRGEQGEVEGEPAVAAQGESALELGEVVVAGHVADLQRVIAADMEGRRELDAALGVAEDGEGVRPGGRDPVVEAVANIDGRRGGGRTGREHKPEGHQRGCDYKLARYSVSHRLQASTLCCLFSGGSERRKPLSCPVRILRA